MNYLACNKVLSSIKTLLEGKYTFQVGLLLVYQDTNCKCIIDLIPTPLDPTEIIETPLQINKNIIAEHAFQVNRSLVGGVRVGGLYLYTKQEIININQLFPFLKILNRAVHLPSLPELHDLFILQIGDYIKSSYNISMINGINNGNIDLQNISFNFKDDCDFYFHSFETYYSFKLSSYISGNFKLDTKIMKSAQEFLKQTKQESYIFSIDNEFYSSPNDITISKLHNNSLLDHNIKIFSQNPNYMNEFTIGDRKQSSLLCKIQGNYVLYCLALSSATISDIYQFLWEDLHRTILQRIDVLSLYKESQTQWALPYRVLIKSSVFPIMLCDYILPDENKDDSIARLQELLGSSIINTNNVEILFKEKPSTIINELQKPKKQYNDYNINRDLSDNSNKIKPRFSEDNQSSFSLPIIFSFIVFLLALLCILFIGN